MIELRYCLYVFYFFLGISNTVYGFSMRKDLQAYGLSLAELTYHIMFPNLPWMFKFLFAAISDTFNLCGLKHKPYIILSNFFSAILCLILILKYPLLPQYIGIMFTLNIFAAWADVMYNSLLVYLSCNDDESGFVQSRTLFLKQLGQIVGRTLGAPLWQSLGSNGVYGLNSVFFVIPFAVAFLLPEIDEERNKKNRTKKRRVSISIAVDAYGKDIKPIEGGGEEEEEEEEEEKESMSKMVCWSLGMMSNSLQHPYLKVPLLFLLFVSMLPNSGLATFYFINDVARVTPYEIAILDLSSELVSLAVFATFDFCCLRRLEIRYIFIILWVFKIACGLTPLWIIEPVNNRSCLRVVNETLSYNTTVCYETDFLVNPPPAFYISGEYVFGSAFDEYTSRPVERIARLVCYHAFGATVYTFIQSSLNAVSGVGMFFISVMMKYFDIDHDKYIALAAYQKFCVVLEALCIFIPIFFFPRKTIDEIKEEVDNERDEQKFVKGVLAQEMMDLKEEEEKGKGKGKNKKKKEEEDNLEDDEMII